jgi:hypothetical protein
MAASDYAPTLFKNCLHLAGRPPMSPRPNRAACNLRDLGLADQVRRAIYRKVEGILGPPILMPASKPVKTEDIRNARCRRRGARDNTPPMREAA